MMGRLDRYVARTFASSWLVSLVFFVGLFGIFDFFAKLDDFLEHIEGEDGQAALIGRFYLYAAPSIFLQVAPFVMVMAAVFTVTRLTRHNEYAAMIMTGRSPRRVLMPVFALSALLVVVVVWVQEDVAPRLANARDRYRTILLEDRTDWVVPSIEIKDDSGRLLVFKNYNVESGDVGSITCSFIDERGRNHRIEGRGGRWQEAGGGDEGWRLQEGRLSRLDMGSGEPAVEEQVAFLATDVGPDDLRSSERPPFDLSLGQLVELSERYPLNKRYRLLRHYHVTFPLSVFLLVVLGVPFLVRSESRSVVLGVALSFGLCLGFLVLDMAMRDLGSRGFLPPTLAAWLPVVLAGSFGVVLLDAME